MAWTEERQREYSREYYQKNKERMKADALAYYYSGRCKKDPDRVAMAQEKYRSKNASLIAAKRNGVDPSTIATRPLLCEVCGGRTKHSLHLDHDHATGKFRGWLCHNCNSALGHVKDNVETLIKLAAYLERMTK